MADRPPRDVNWISDDTTGITVPGSAKQAVGWIVQKPPRQFFNWFWNRGSRWFHYLSGQSEEYIIIDSTNDNEKDYDTLAAYIADSPAANDKVLVKESQALTAQMTIPSGITLRLLDGIEFTRTTLEAVSVIKFGSDIIVEGVLNLVLSQTGTTAKAIEFDGDNVVGKIDVENASTGTLTTAYHINASKTGNIIDGFVNNSGAGSITNNFVDASTENSNLLILVDGSNGVLVNNSFADLFSDQTIAGTKTFPDKIIGSGGLETDNVPFKTKMLHIGPWDMDSATQKSVTHGLTGAHIRTVSATIREDTLFNTFDFNVLDTTETGARNIQWGSATVILSRAPGGPLDSVGFDRTEFNLDNAAAVDKGSGLVGIPITAHEFSSKDETVIAGTTNYDGTHKIVSETANEIVIEATFVSETFAGTETASWSRGWVFVEYEV